MMERNQRISDCCYRCFPCLADPAWRSSLGLKAALVTIHLVYAGILVLFDKDFVDKIRMAPWYTALYVMLFVATLIQYFITACTSPGYVLDAMRSLNEAFSLLGKAVPSNHIDSSKNGSVVITVDSSESGRILHGNSSSSWSKMVMELYPPQTSTRSMTCPYCNIEQPPRAKHCHDCDRCVLQFDHHCIWLGRCVGQGNHCRFWWYICEETALCLWTAILYITYLKFNIARAWWKDIIMIMLLVGLCICLIFLLLLSLFHSYLVLTNQTTYELVRRRRIHYLRGFPERVFPFSKGMCQNLYIFCLGWGRKYEMERLPTALELEERSRAVTCRETLTCCWKKSETASD